MWHFTYIYVNTYINICNLSSSYVIQTFSMSLNLLGSDIVFSKDVMSLYSKLTGVNWLVQAFKIIKIEHWSLGVFILGQFIPGGLIPVALKPPKPDFMYLHTSSSSSWSVGWKPVGVQWKFYHLSSFPSRCFPTVVITLIGPAKSL